MLIRGDTAYPHVWRTHRCRRRRTSDPVSCRRPRGVPADSDKLSLGSDARQHRDAELRNWLTIAAISLLVLCPASVIGLDCIVTVDAGTIGVQNTFGDVADNELTPGISFKNPFTDVTQYSTQTQQVFEISSVPSKEGLIVTLDVSILYKIMPTRANEIHKNLGVSYSDTVIISQLRSVTREITAKYEAKALYTIGRENITNEIFKTLEPVIAERGIILEKVLLRDLKLPATVTTAIEQKLKAEQEAEQMQFVLQKETQEAERKRVEARGIADAQAIIHESLTPAYLTWYFITHLKDSEKVYFVPVGDTGLPLFFDMQGIVGK